MIYTIIYRGRTYKYATLEKAQSAAQYVFERTGIIVGIGVK